MTACILLSNQKHIWLRSLSKKIYVWRLHCSSLRLAVLQVTLSEAQRVSLKLPVGGPGGRGVAAVLTRQHFEKLATPLFERMRLAVDEACWQVSSLLFASPPLMQSDCVV